MLTRMYVSNIGGFIVIRAILAGYVPCPVDILLFAILLIFQGVNAYLETGPTTLEFLFFSNHKPEPWTVYGISLFMVYPQRLFIFVVCV